VINLRDLIRLGEKYKTHRIEVLGLVSDKNDPLIATVRKFARRQKIKFQVIWDNDDFEESLVKLVNGRSVLPQTFIIDRAGRVRKHFQGYSPLNMPQLLREGLDQVGKETEPNKPRLSP
jgi:peroxiredoxin